MTRTVLITGFGPFPGAPHNPTPALVHALLRLRRPSLSDVRVVAHIFKTSYATVDAELPGLLAEYSPDAVLMFGLAARTPYVRLEMLARNSRSGLLADVAGALPRSRAIQVGGPATRAGRVPFTPLLGAVRATRVPVRLSRNAGRYLCNYAYWRAAELLAARPEVPFLFVHVPALSRKAKHRKERRRVNAADLARAGAAVLLALSRRR